MTRVILRERIPPTDPRLGRRINHDSESRRFAFPTAALSIVSAKHTRRIPVLDQGQLGSCTGNAGIGCLGTDPFYDTIDKLAHYQFSETDAVDLYSDATRADDYPGGYYAPGWQDTGSDGLTIAKVLTAAGEISGYQHTFSLDAALKALTVTPFITGTNWYDDMFNPDPDGRVHPTGSLAGGHELVADEIDAERERVWFTNSWGAWGVGGRFYLTFADFGSLLAQQGDVTIFTPLTQPAPVPVPPTPVPPVPGDPADVAFANVLHHHDWIHQRHVADNMHVATAARIWLSKKGL